MIRVLVADDQAAVRGGFAALVAAEEEMEVVGEASNGREAVEITRRVFPPGGVDGHPDADAGRAGSSQAHLR